MDKIDAVALVHVLEHAAGALYAQGIPAYVGYGQTRGHTPLHADDFAFQEAEAGVLAVLVAALKEELHSEADAHYGLAARDCAAHGLVHAGLTEFGIGVRKSPDAREYDAVGIQYFSTFPGDYGLLADGGKG